MSEPITGVLRPDIELIPGKTPLLFDPAADTYFKISPECQMIIAFLTESMPLAQFMEALRRQGIFMTKMQLIRILDFLRQNNLLIPDYGMTDLMRRKQADVREKTWFLRFAAMYLFFRFPPLRPEKLFEKISPCVSWLASRKFVLILTFPAVLGYLLLIRNFNTVQQTFWNSLSWVGLVKYFFAIISLKIVHESAHSIAAMHFHCRVRGIGLGFMVFFPRLYTDTTDSWRLPREQRLLIDGAGIIAELIFGGIAALLWCYLPPGPWRSTMFYIFAVSTISTLLVNGNPCIRYDGYYILCDCMNIENLMSRSNDYFRHFWRWSCLRLGNRPREEKGWFLLCFGILSFTYRFFLYTSIILVIYHKFTKTLAVIMMFMELFTVLIYPCWREVQTIRTLSKKSTGKAHFLLPFALIALLFLILCFPLSWSICLPGETAPVKRSLITVSEGGYLDVRMPDIAKKVLKDEPLILLRSPQMDFSIARMENQIEYNKILLKLQQLDESSFSESVVTEQKILSDQQGLMELERRKAALRITAAAPGIFLPSLPGISRNVYLPKGYKVGEIISEDQLVYAYCDDYNIGDLQKGDHAEIFISGELTPVQGIVCEISPVAASLKDSPLLQTYGGSIAVVPEPHSAGEYRSEHPLYRITIDLSDRKAVDPGRVVSVKIYKKEQIYKRIFQFLLSAFRREF